MFKKEKSESIFEYFNIIDAQQTLNSLGLGLSVNLNTKVDALHYKHSAIFFNFLSLHEEKKKKYTSETSTQPRDYTTFGKFNYL